uniref:Helicase C-terminal domain-containing protein n=1 Tax=Setaria italica TaxID=4555 RepID=K3XJT6_SETIT
MQWSELLLEAIDRGQGNSVRRLAKRLLESFDHEVWKKYKNSCKISFILDLVNELFEEEKAEKKKDLGMRKNKNLKILIFSQFISMLDRIEIALKAIGKEGDTIRIDGSMERTERDQKIKVIPYLFLQRVLISPLNFLLFTYLLIVQKFSSQVEDAPKIFLLSARVGGEGLNLTAATRVIIVDPSWNISDDNQIADRVFRIGQKEDVTVYRLVTCMTIEEDIYKTQILKGNLARAILEGKVCSPLVELEDRKFIRLPECGFNSSKTQQLLETLMGDILEMRSRHQRFLQKHHLVAGLTNQEVISSHEEISLIDLPLGERLHVFIINLNFHIYEFF